MISSIQLDNNIHYCYVMKINKKTFDYTVDSMV